MSDRTLKKPASAGAIDVPDADVAEQRREVLDEAENGTNSDEPPPFDADPADAADQRIEVVFDDDEYR